jgi:polysaccharide biosynthesis transport protein
VVSVVVAVAAALAYSKLQTPTYQSTALIQETTTAGTGGSTPAVTLPDPVTELGSTAVQDRAAAILKDPNVSTVANEVTGTADPTTGQLTISANDSDPARAQAVARAYSEAFVAQTKSIVNAQINTLTDEKNTLISEINALGPSSNPTVEAEIQGYESTISSLQQQISAIQVGGQAGGAYAVIQVAAGLPTSPIGLSKSKLGGIGLIAGLLVGCGIALARDQFDTRLRTNPDIESITDAPILPELPQDNEVRTGKVAIAMVQAPQSQMAESIRELRTSLRVILDDAPCPVMVVTSPEPGDGKTFVTANLAASWAMSGSKVIVVSADFRRPRLEEIFGLQTSGLPGLANLIKSNWKNPERDNAQTDRVEGTPDGTNDRRQPPGRTPDGTNDRRQPPGRTPSSRARRDIRTEPDQSSVSSFLVDSGIWGLHVLPAGTELENPSELFGSPGMQPVLDQLALLADIVLLDTPPVLVVPDTAILGSLAHGAVVVASEGKTDRADLERTIRRLETTHCRVLGVAINRVRRSSTESYSSYSYKQ